MRLGQTLTLLSFQKLEVSQVGFSSFLPHLVVDSAVVVAVVVAVAVVTHVP